MAEDFDVEAMLEAPYQKNVSGFTYTHKGVERIHTCACVCVRRLKTYIQTYICTYKTSGVMYSQPDIKRIGKT